MLIDVSDGGAMQETQDKTRRESARPRHRAARRRATICCVWYAFIGCTLSMGSRAAFEHSDDHAGSAGFDLDESESVVCEDSYDTHGRDCTGEGVDGSDDGSDEGDKRGRLAISPYVLAIPPGQGLRQRYLVGGGLRPTLAIPQ